jgi:hypothetical protein
MPSPLKCHLETCLDLLARPAPISTFHPRYPSRGSNGRRQSNYFALLLVVLGHTGTSLSISSVYWANKNAKTFSSRLVSICIIIQRNYMTHHSPEEARPCRCLFVINLSAVEASRETPIACVIKFRAASFFRRRRDS